MTNLISAIAVINPHILNDKSKQNKSNKLCFGTVEFKEVKFKNEVEITVNLKNMKPGLHGFHIHETGNLEGGCGSCCAHFNPTNSLHGGPNDTVRHTGDLGNIKVNKDGICKQKLIDKKIKLRGNKFNIIGRSVVIHADEDDLGKGDNSESLKTGNAGSRIGCAVIGYKSAFYF